MPIYEYICQKCGHHLEIMQKMSDKPLTKCPECKGRLEKIFSQTSFQLKGSGWYVSDYTARGKAEKAETPDKADKVEKADTANKADQSEKTEKADKPGNNDKSDKVEKIEKSDKVDKTDKADKGSKKDKSATI